MNAKRERVKLKDEVLPPGEDVFDGLSAKSLDADSAVACDAPHFPADKRAQLLGGKVDGRPFHCSVFLTTWRRIIRDGGLEHSPGAQREISGARLSA